VADWINVLEGTSYHSICTGTPVATPDFNIGWKNGVNMVNYAPANLHRLRRAAHPTHVTDPAWLPLED